MFSLRNLCFCLFLQTCLRTYKSVKYCPSSCQEVSMLQYHSHESLQSLMSGSWASFMSIHERTHKHAQVACEWLAVHPYMRFHLHTVSTLKLRIAMLLTQSDARPMPKLSKKQLRFIDNSMISNDELTCTSWQLREILEDCWPDIKVSLSTVKWAQKDLQ